jgi:hypothetical protein
MSPLGSSGQEEAAFFFPTPRSYSSKVVLKGAKVTYCFISSHVPQPALRSHLMCVAYAGGLIKGNALNAGIPCDVLQGLGPVKYFNLVLGAATGRLCVAVCGEGFFPLCAFLIYIMNLSSKL